MRVVELKGGLRISELFHGPTLAFKDLGLGVVARLLQVNQQRVFTMFISLFKEVKFTYVQMLWLIPKYRVSQKLLPHFMLKFLST